MWLSKRPTFVFGVNLWALQPQPPGVNKKQYLLYTLYFYNNEPSKNRHFLILLSSLAKGQTKSKCFQADISSKKWRNEFAFTSMIPQVDLFSFAFWRKLKTPKRHFEINWHLTSWDSILSNIFRNFRSIETRTMLTHKFLQQLLMRRKYNLPIPHFL